MLAHVNPRIPAMKTHQSIKMTGVNNIAATTLFTIKTMWKDGVKTH